MKIILRMLYVFLSVFTVLQASDYDQIKKLNVSDRSENANVSTKSSILDENARVKATLESNTVNNSDSDYISSTPAHVPIILHVPSEYATIQAGIDAAVEGDTILIAPGSYNNGTPSVPTYFIPQSISMAIGSYFLTTGDTSYISQTVINNADFYYNNQSSQCLLSGLTIQNGTRGVWCNNSNVNIDHVVIKECGDGILFTNGSSGSITDCFIKNCSGSGVNLNVSSASITDCVIKDNDSHGIYCYHSENTGKELTIINTISNNNENSGLYATRCGILIDNSTFNHNNFRGFDGIQLSSLLIKNSKIQHNKNFGGVHIEFCHNARLENVLITDNAGATENTSLAAGGITLTNSDVVMVNLTVANNQAVPRFGGGILCYGVCKPLLINSIISSNSAPQLQSWHTTNFKIAYSTLDVGEQVPVTTAYNGTYSLLENIQYANPLFEQDYTLQNISPCIDEGAAYYSLSDSVYVNMGASNYVGAAPDMGALEYATLIPSIAADFDIHGLNNGPAPLVIQVIDFSQSENTSINSWHWDFGDGHSSTAPNPQHTYNTPGIYSVSLTISDGILSDTKTMDNYITVYGTPPVTNFSALMTSGFAPFQTVFKNESTGEISEFLWNFGDSETSTMENPYHTYQDTGKYTVQLITSNSAGADTLSKINYIHVTQSTAIEIYVSKSGSDDTGTGSETQPFLTIQKGIDEANTNDIVTVLNGTYIEYLRFNGRAFTLRSQNGPENCIVNCNNNLDGFYFQDDEPNSMVVQGFTVTNAYYAFKLEGASPLIQGNVITACKVGIYASINWGTDKGSNPIIYKNLICDNTEQGVCVSESGSAYIANNTISRNGIAGVETFLADITVVNNIITDHEKGIAFLSPGYGSVLESHNCLWNNTTQYVSVVPDSTDIAENPLFVNAADFHLQETSPCIDTGNPLFPRDPDGTIVDMGVFYYSQISDSLIADFAADVLNGTAPLTVVFTDRSEGEPTAWTWEFGDGSSSQEQHPSHVYAEPGIYIVKLIVSDGILSDSLTKNDYITVNELIVNPPSLSGFVKLETGPENDATHYINLSAVSGDIAYLVTNSNRLYKTVNGGSTWQDITPEIQSNIVGATAKVHFINENIGSLALSVDDGGNNYNYDIVYGYVWCTRDGGQTWSQRFDVNEDQIMHLQQVTENIVYVSGTARFGVTSTRWFKKITYDPEASTYTLQSMTPTPTSRPHVMSAHWLNQTSGIALGKYNVPPYTCQVFKTSDGGNSWQSIHGDLPGLYNSYWSYSGKSLQILDEDSYVFVLTHLVSGTPQTNIWRTDDGGTHWVESSFNSEPGRLHAITMAENDLDGIAVGYDSTKACFITNDGGFNWNLTVLPEIVNNHLYGCDISLDGSTWVYGSLKSLWKSSSELIADFEADVTSGNTPLEIHFLDKSQQGSHSVTSWNWQFGDGESSPVQNPVHTYVLPGNYTVSLTVGDGANSDTKEIVHYIHVENAVNAVITTVEDVPSDQGGWVTVHFIRSGFDTDSLDVQTAIEDSLELYSVEINDGNGWVSSNSTVAYGSKNYSILVHTSVDSSAESNGILDFRVISGMTEGSFSSNIVQGYSVDNLAPAVPTGLRAEIAATTIVINWDASINNDLQYYNIYRSVNEDFNGQETSPYSSTIESSFTDDMLETDQTYYYRVSAIDFNGNESAKSQTASILVGINDLQALPEIFELSQNYPNPFNPMTTLGYGLPEVSDITLTIINLTGRKIEQWTISNQQPGWHKVIWDGTDMNGNVVSTGVYIYRLQADKFIDTKKMVFLK